MRVDAWRKGIFTPSSHYNDYSATDYGPSTVSRSGSPTVDSAFIDQIDNKFVSLKRIKGAGHLCIKPTYRDAMELVTSFCREHLQ